MTKARVLYFNSKNEALLLKKKVEDGFIHFKEKAFYVENSRPILLKGRMGYTPLYLIKWDTVQPAKVDLSNVLPKKVRKELEKKQVKIPQNVTQVVFQRDKDYTPEALKKTVSLTILGNMIKLRREVAGIVPMIIGVVIGAIVMFAMNYFGVF